MCVFELFIIYSFGVQSFPFAVLSIKFIFIEYKAVITRSTHNTTVYILNFVYFDGETEFLLLIVHATFFCFILLNLFALMLSLTGTTSLADSAHFSFMGLAHRAKVDVVKTPLNSKTIKNGNFFNASGVPALTNLR